MRFACFSGKWEELEVADSYEIWMCKRIYAHQTGNSGEVPFFKIGTIGGKADAFIERKLFEEYKSKYHFPKPGETLITCSGTVGRCVQYDGNPAYYQDSNIVWLHSNEALISNDFLFRLLTKQNWKALNTTTISRIYSSDLLSLRFSYPPNRREQGKICELLQLVDNRISAQNKIFWER